jgi:hypothetical protein
MLFKEKWLITVKIVRNIQAQLPVKIQTILKPAARLVTAVL